MSLTTEQERRLRAALDRARRETRGADRAAQVRAAKAAVRAATDGLPTPAVVAFLRAYDREQQEQRRRNQRTLAALDALMGALAAEGVATPGELMRRRGLATVPALLASLGCAGDLEALAAELQRALGRASR